MVERIIPRSPLDPIWLTTSLLSTVYITHSCQRVESSFRLVHTQLYIYTI